PKGAELIWAGFWTLGGESLARLSGGLVLAAALYAALVFARRWKTPEWPVCLILTACPFWLAIFGWGYDEGLLALYEVLILMGLDFSLREPRNRPIGFAVAFFFAGAALGVKYTALFAWSGLGVILLYEKFWTNPKIRFDWKWIFWISLPCVPWLLRNALANGNPFYPMAESWWGGPPGYNASMESALWADTGSLGHWTLLSALKTLALDFGTSRNQVGAFLAPLLLMSVPFWKLLRKSDEAKRWFIFSAVFFAAWIIFCTNLRHAAGGLLALVFLAGAAWALGLRSSHRSLRWVFVLGLVFSIWGTWVVQANSTRPYGCALGIQDPLARLGRNYNIDFDSFAAYATVEKNSAPLDKSMAFGVYETYPLRRTAFVDFFWKKPIFLAWASHCQTAEQLAEKLKREGVTTFIYQRLEAVYMSRKEKDFKLSGMSVSEYSRFWRLYTEPIASFENSTVYQMRTRPLPQPRFLTDIPGLEEAGLFPIFRTEQKRQWRAAYQAAVEFTERFPFLGIGWERRACDAGRLKRWKEAVVSGRRAEGLETESLDLCDTMVQGCAFLHETKDLAMWQAKRTSRQKWLADVKRNAISFEEK
ncbi:MAG: hypothetical protein ACREL1_00925, partial [bacterium]